MVLLELHGDLMQVLNEFSQVKKREAFVMKKRRLLCWKENLSQIIKKDEAEREAGMCLLM